MAVRGIYMVPTLTWFFTVATAEEGRMIRGKKRHPTIEDDVVIYAGATILGGTTVIGRGSVIGGNVWLTRSVPAYTRVIISEPELVIDSK